MPGWRDGKTERRKDGETHDPLGLHPPRRHLGLRRLADARGGSGVHQAAARHQDQRRAPPPLGQHPLARRPPARELEPTAAVHLPRLAIHERLELLREDFPVGVSAPQVTNYVPEELDEQPLLQYSLAGAYTPGTLTRLADEQLKPRLTAVPGVSSVTAFGSSENGVSVSYDVQRLRQLDISPTLLAAAIAGARVVQSLGEEHRGAAVRTVVLRDQPHAYQDLERIPVRAGNGRVYPLAELASVRPEEDNQGRFSRLNGVPAVGLEITRLLGADVIQTARRVKAAMAGIQELLPAGVTARLESDESVGLAKELRDLVIRGTISFVAVCLILLVTLRHVGSAALVMGSAAVAIAGTALGLYLFGIPANLLTLAGLGMGVGILVQNGVVVVERLRAGSAAVAIAGTALGLYLFGIPANLLTLAGLGMGVGILVQNGVVVVERL